MVCVPLFLLLTGYLMSEKCIPIDKEGYLKYAKNLLKIVITYFLAVAFITLYRMIVLKDCLSFTEALRTFLGYGYYSWYINMYIGLYLIIPFLNLAWRACDTKEKRRVLLIACAALSIAPSIFNIYDFGIVPDYWTGLYPVMYYFVGAYIKKDINVKQLNSCRLLLLFVITVCLSGIFNICYFSGDVFESGLLDSWGGFENTINSLLLFLLINSINYKRKSGTIIALLSELTLGAYLVSYLPDSFIYPWVAGKTVGMGQKLMYMPLTCGGTVVISFGISFASTEEGLLGLQRFNQSLGVEHTRRCAGLHLDGEARSAFFDQEIHFSWTIL